MPGQGAVKAVAGVVVGGEHGGRRRRGNAHGYPVMTNLSGNARGNLSGAADGPESEAAQLVARARVMMVISGLTTALAIAAVVTVIGYRMFAGAGAVSGDGIVTLPKGARVMS